MKKRKINILFLVHGFDIGGVEKCNVEMINVIDKKKFNVHVFFINEGILMDDLDINSIQIQKLGDEFKLTSLHNIKYVMRIIKYNKKNNIEIIHTIDPILYMVGSVAAHLSKIKHIRTQPNFIRRHEKLNTKTLRLLPFERWTNKYITYNLASKKDLQLAGVESNKIETIYNINKPKNYENFNDFKDIKEEFKIPKNYKIILAMHRMVEQKGYETFIEMIPLILKEYSEVCFLLVGDGPLKKELEYKVKKLNIENNVIFTGFRTDIYNIINQIDFGVYPLADTAAMVDVILGNKVLITRKNSSMDEYVLDGITGYLTPDDNPETYAKYSLKLLKDQRLLESMEENQREFTLENFDGNKSIKKFEDVLSALIVKSESVK